MCHKPKTFAGGVVASCGSCDACVAQRRMEWVARAMAEKTLHPYCYSLTLTYGSETAFQREGASMFRYGDVSDWLKNLRRQISYHHGKDKGLIRFICAGEQGSRNGRVHWHIILYSQVDLLGVGTYHAIRGGKKVQVTKPTHIISGSGEDDRKIRLDWSFWKHGFTTFQIPDQSGMSYALSYALKDQFSEEKSRGHGREGNGEEFAAGLFRPSKRPPIGWGFVAKWLQGLAERGQVSPDLQIQIPDFKGYYIPRKTIRHMTLTVLRRINQSVVRATGRNAPQWSSLIQTCINSPSDLEVLRHGEKEQDPETSETIAARNSREYHAARRDRETRKRCGSTFPCNDCLRDYAERDLARVYICPEPGDYGFFYDTRHRDAEAFRRGQKDAACGGINPLCKQKEAPHVKRCFPQSARR